MRCRRSPPAPLRPARCGRSSDGSSARRLRARPTGRARPVAASSRPLSPRPARRWWGALKVANVLCHSAVAAGAAPTHIAKLWSRMVCTALTIRAVHEGHCEAARWHRIVFAAAHPPDTTYATCVQQQPDTCMVSEKSKQLREKLAENPQRLELCESKPKAKPSSHLPKAKPSSHARLRATLERQSWKSQT